MYYIYSGMARQTERQKKYFSIKFLFNNKFIISRKFIYKSMKVVFYMMKHALVVIIF